jgi:hypothetical protein
MVRCDSYPQVVFGVRFRICSVPSSLLVCTFQLDPLRYAFRRSQWYSVDLPALPDYGAQGKRVHAESHIECLGRNVSRIECGKYAACPFGRYPGHEPYNSLLTAP